MNLCYYNRMKFTVNEILLKSYACYVIFDSYTLVYTIFWDERLNDLEKAFIYSVRCEW